MARRSTVRRETGETRIELSLDLDGGGRAQIATGVGFFDHMLTLLARHSLIDLTVRVANGKLKKRPRRREPLTSRGHGSPVPHLWQVRGSHFAGGHRRPPAA